MCASKRACVCTLSGFIRVVWAYLCRHACTYVTESRREQGPVGLEKSQHSKKMCCNYVSLLTLL